MPGNVQARKNPQVRGSGIGSFMALARIYLFDPNPVYKV
jgi:hypothetical protein